MKKPLFIIKVNSSGFGDILKQWYILFTIGYHLGFEYVHYLKTISMAENHLDYNKNTFKKHPFFLQFNKFININSHDFERVNIEIKPHNNILTIEDINEIKKNINYEKNIIYTLSFPNIYSTEIKIPFDNLPLKYLNYQNDNNLIIHIRRGDTSFLPISPNNFLCPSGKIYKNLAQLFVNEKVIRERYIPIEYFFIKLREFIRSKKINNIVICSDGYTLMKKHTDLLLTTFPENFKNKNQVINKINNYEKNELELLTSFFERRKNPLKVYYNEEETNINEMINLCQKSNNLIYGKSCFFQNIFKIIYNNNNFNYIKIEPPYSNIMKENRLLRELKNKKNNYLINFNS